MRLPFLIAGALVDLLGTVWILQGLNVLPGSRMSGDPFWAGAGVVAVGIGVVLVIVGVRKNVSAGR